jgi:hypothetical protein
MGSPVITCAARVRPSGAVAKATAPEVGPGTP